MLPEEFLQRLEQIIPGGSLPSVKASFAAPHPVCIRVNTLKITVEAAVAEMQHAGWALQPLAGVSGAFIILNSNVPVSSSQLSIEGKIYQQAPSSLLPVLALDVKAGDVVLDACAAPGSKTTQIAALLGGHGRVVANESVKGRFFKLISVCKLLNAEPAVTCKMFDARRLRFPSSSFDKILVDAPCSSEGRFKEFEPRSTEFWSRRKIEEMSHKQKGILLNVSRFLKPGGSLVYSTCSFAPEENEEVVDWFLKKTDGRFTLEDPGLCKVPRYPVLRGWKKRSYAYDLSVCLRVLPDSVYSGFFIAKFKLSV